MTLDHVHTQRKRITKICRVLEKDGSEYLRISQSPTAAILPWDKDTLAALHSQFGKDTKFSVRNEANCRTYDGPRKWWEKLTAKEFIESCIYGRRISA